MGQPLELKVQPFDVSNIALEGGDPHMPMMNLNVMIKIPVLQLVNVLAEFQKNIEAQKVKPVYAFQGKIPPPPPPVPPGDREMHEAAILHKAALNGGGGGEVQRGPVAPGVVVDRSHDLPPHANPQSSSASEAAATRREAAQWTTPINELQANHDEYSRKVKWTALGEKGQSRWTYILEDEQILADFEPLPCEPPKLVHLKPGTGGVGRQPPGPPPLSSAMDGEQEPASEPALESELRQPPPGAPPPAPPPASPPPGLMDNTARASQRPPPPTHTPPLTQGDAASPAGGGSGGGATGRGGPSNQKECKQQ